MPVLSLLRIVFIAGFMMGTVSAGFGDDDDDDDDDDVMLLLLNDDAPVWCGAFTRVTVGRVVGITLPLLTAEPIDTPADFTASAIANA